MGQDEVKRPGTEMTHTKALVSNEQDVAVLEYLLSNVSQRLVRYVRESPEALVGERYDGPTLYEELVGSGKIEVPEHGYGAGSTTGLEKVLGQVDLILETSVNTWSLGFLDKLYASTNPIGLISDMVLSILNTNSHVFSVSPALSVIEKKVGREYARLFYGRNNTACGGLTFSGGSWSNITSMHMAKVYLFPDTKTSGNGTHRFAVFTSSHSHYSLVKSAILCGIGSDAVFKVAVNSSGEMDVQDLQAKILDAKLKGFTPFYINATAGTTVFGSFDPIEEIAKVAENHNLWLHVDGSWGGNFIFSDKLKHKLRGIEKAHSITSNPHKQLGVPTTCSFLLLQNEKRFQDSNSLNAPYLFHRSLSDDISTLDGPDNFDLADGTLGCGRRADALKFYLSWYFYGRAGFQKRVEYAYSIAEYFSESIGHDSRFTLLNSFKTVGKSAVPCLQVCFYYNPYDTAPADYTEITRVISHKLHEKGKYLIDYSPYPDQKHPQAKGEFFRIVFINPKLTTQFVDKLIEDIVATGELLEKRG